MNNTTSTTPTYFKYTTGDAFLLDGATYVGYFHISNGIPYTGKVDDPEMVELTPKNTLIASFYSKIKNFNNTYKNIDQLVRYYPNVHDLFTKKDLTNSFGQIDDNNLKAFKGLVLHHPTIYDLDQPNNHYYTIETSDEEEPTYKDEITVSMGFKDSEKWSFLDTVHTGDIIIGTDDGFKYVCSNGYNLYIVSGSFLKDHTDPLILDYKESVNEFYPFPNDRDEFIFNIHHNQDTQQLFILKNSKIDIYDTSNFYKCGVFLLIDSISLNHEQITHYVWGITKQTFETANFTYGTAFKVDTEQSKQEFMRFGKNFRVSVVNSVLTIWNMYSSDILKSISLEPYNFSSLYCLDVRPVDDNILVLFKNTSNQFKILFIDSDFSITISDIFGLLDTAQYTLKEYGGYFNPNYAIRFSSIDSDVFYLYNGKEYQSRFISSPKYPAGRLEESGLYYDDGLIWGLVQEKYDNVRRIWGEYGELEASPNFILGVEQMKHGNMHSLIHTHGRIITLTQPISEMFYKNISFNTIKRYNGIQGSESSIGLHFNQLLKNIVYDTLELYTNSGNAFDIKEREVILKYIDNITLEYKNLFLNENETLNVSAISRIYNYLYELQFELIPTTD